MTRVDDARLGVRVTRAMVTAGVLRPTAPSKLRRAVHAGRSLQATHAASVAIAAALNPDAVAVIDDAGTITWGKLDSHSRAIAAALASDYGVGPDQALAILCRNHRGAIEALAAAAHCGADALLLNTEMPADQLGKVLQTYPVAAIAHDDEFAERLDAAGADRRTRVRVWPDGPGNEPTFADLVARGGVASSPTRRNRIVILTSGTTGIPKAAARDIPARAMAGPLLAMIEHFGMRRGEPVYIGPPLFHGFGLGVASVATAIGAPLILHRRFDPLRAAEAISEYRAGCVIGVPVMLQRILESGASRDLPSLRGVVSAGAPLPPALAGRLLDAYGDKVINAYGSTETGFGAFATAADLRAAPGTIGRAPYGTRIEVLDADHAPVAAGRIGHIFIGGDLVFDGYVNGGSKELAHGLMNTGDLGHLDSAGRLFVDGREDDMIVSGGENVFPQEVEDVLSTHSGVADVAVVGVPDAEFGQRLIAFIVLAPATPLTSEDLIAYLRGQVERYKLPRAIEFCAEIPRTATGKVLRRQLVPQGETS